MYTEYRGTLYAGRQADRHGNPKDEAGGTQDETAGDLLSFEDQKRESVIGLLYLNQTMRPSSGIRHLTAALRPGNRISIDQLPATDPIQQFEVVLARSKIKWIMWLAASQSRRQTG